MSGYDPEEKLKAYGITRDGKPATGFANAKMTAYSEIAARHAQEEAARNLAALDEAIRLFKSKRIALNSQFEAVDVLREDGIYQIVIEDLEEIRARHVKAAL